MKNGNKRLQKFMKKRRHLAWYVKNPEYLDEESILEHVLNYGNFDDVRKLFNIMGVKRAAGIFREKVNHWRCNYFPKVKHYFNLYFDKYAPLS